MMHSAYINENTAEQDQYDRGLKKLGNDDGATTIAKACSVYLLLLWCSGFAIAVGLLEARLAATCHALAIADAGHSHVDLIVLHHSHRYCWRRNHT